MKNSLSSRIWQLRKRQGLAGGRAQDPEGVRPGRAELKEKRWGLITRASGRYLSAMNNDIVTYPVDGIPNTVKIYEIVHNDIRPSRINASEVFRHELDEYIQNAGL